MPAVYGSATIANAPSAGVDDQPVQPPIGYNLLGTDSGNTEMWNGHIGASLDQVVTPQERAEQIAADDTPGVDAEGDQGVYWDTSTGTWGAGPFPEAPANTVLPAISGDPEVGSTLTTTTGTWTGEPTPTYTYQWLADGEPIPGATDDSLELTAGEVGADISVEVTATNASGSASVESEPVGPVTTP